MLIKCAEIRNRICAFALQDIVQRPMHIKHKGSLHYRVVHTHAYLDLVVHDVSCEHTSRANVMHKHGSVYRHVYLDLAQTCRQLRKEFIPIH